MNDTRHAPIAIAWITGVCLLGDSMLYIVLPVYGMQQYGLDSFWQIGLLLSVNRLVRLPLGPLIGWLYARMPVRVGITAAVAAASLTTLAFGLGSGFALLLAARALWGAAWSLLRIGGYLVILDASAPGGGDNRGQLLGRYNGIMGMGSLAGMLLGGMLADVLGVRLVAAVLGAVMLLALPLAWRRLPAQAAHSKAGAKQPETQPPQRTAASLRSSRFAVLTLSSGLGMGFVFFGILLAGLSPLLASRLPNGTAITLFGASLGAASLAGIAQAIRWGWSPLLSPWIGKRSDALPDRRGLYAAVLGLGAVSFALLAAPVPLPLWLLALLGVMLASTAITTLTDAMASDAAAGRSAVTFMTTYTVVIDVGAALGPLAAVGLLAALGPDGLSSACAICLALLTAAWLIFGGKRDVV
ncbi:MFS transporter [Paenibacillus sp. EPM92]|uniref:MFS transporter n=1 Tax=Paenibacillus sp. EPM92 TaxID=1561195 RepID=UPI001915DAF7|nr:MFS transporter [Paenibacillus sp. EPM92]